MGEISKSLFVQTEMGVNENGVPNTHASFSFGAYMNVYNVNFRFPCIYNGELNIEIRCLIFMLFCLWIKNQTTTTMKQNWNINIHLPFCLSVFCTPRYLKFLTLRWVYLQTYFYQWHGGPGVSIWRIILII